MSLPVVEFVIDCGVIYYKKLLCLRIFRKIDRKSDDHSYTTIFDGAWVWMYDCMLSSGIY
jgi:hypothetical protein